ELERTVNRGRKRHGSRAQARNAKPDDAATTRTRPDDAGGETLKIMSNDADFGLQRDATFSKVMALMDVRLQAATPVVVLHAQEKSPQDMPQNAQPEVWSLFIGGIHHLKEGAPGNQPGTMTEALSRVSLRASPFAAALGIRPPHFEPLYFSIDYTTGH